MANSTNHPTGDGVRGGKYKAEGPVFEKSFNPRVAAHGYGDANIFFLGGHPLNDDLQSGAAISGFQESMLTSLLKVERLSIKQCYRSLFIKEKLDYAGTNPKKLSAALKKIDTEAYTKLLFEEIKNVNPNIIVPMDDIALSAVFTHINQIKKPKGRKYFIYCYRGSILPLRDDFQTQLSAYTRVIPIIGPQLLNQDWIARTYTRIDFKRIADNRINRTPIKDYGLVWIARNSVELARFFNRSFDKNPAFMTFDIETYGGLVTMISFCFDGVEAVSVPLSPYYFSEISPGEMALMWQMVAKALAHPIPKCNQNIKYDWTILERHGFYVNNVVHDTMLKAALLYPELVKALDFLVSIYTPIPYYKDEGREFDPRSHSKDRLNIYNAKDSLGAHIVNVAQDKELEESGQKDLYYNEISPLILIYKNLDEQRIPVDHDQKQRLLSKYLSLYSSNLNILRGLVGDQGFNPRSSQQVGTLLYETLKFPSRTKTDENGIKRYKTDKETLDDLSINHGKNNKMGEVGYRIIARTTLCRKLGKVLEYIETPLYGDGTFGGCSNLAGTETGRSSFSKTIDEILLTDAEIKERKSKKRVRKLGRSLQTITKHGFEIDEEVFDDWEDTQIASDLRSMFVPPKGWVFVEGDGSGAEARAVCVLANAYDSLAAMDQKPKIHAKTAAFVFDLDVNSIKKDHYGHWTPSIPKIGMSYYDAGKRVRHAGNYDMTFFRLAQMTHLPIPECKARMERFHQYEPNIRGVFHKEVDECVTGTKMLETPFGRKIQLFDRITDHVYKKAKAYIPQSTISDHTKFSMRRIIEKLPGYMKLYFFLTEQHDGILALVREDYWERYAEVFKEVYERPISFRRGSLSRDFDLTIPAEMSWSADNWMDLKEVA